MRTLFNIAAFLALAPIYVARGIWHRWRPTAEDRLREAERQAREAMAKDGYVPFGGGCWSSIEKP